MRSPTQVAAYVAAVVLALLIASSASAGAFSRAAEARLLAAINGVREAHGLGPLRADRRLRRAARAHSADMVHRSYFAHGAFAPRLRVFGVRAGTIGETLAWGTGRLGSPRVIVHEWLASPPHRAVLLGPGFRRVGVGAAVGRFAGRPAARVVTADFAGR